MDKLPVELIDPPFAVFSTATGEQKRGPVWLDESYFLGDRLILVYEFFVTEPFIVRAMALVFMDGSTREKRVAASLAAGDTFRVQWTIDGDVK